MCGVLFITEAGAKADVAEVAEAEEAGEETEEADTETAFKCSGTALIRAVESDASTTLEMGTEARTRVPSEKRLSATADEFLEAVTEEGTKTGTEGRTDAQR